MMTLIAAALAAAQPVPAPMPQGQTMPMNREQHETMKKKCCCDDMGKEGHDMHAPDGPPREHSGE